MLQVENSAQHIWSIHICELLFLVLLIKSIVPVFCTAHSAHCSDSWLSTVVWVKPTSLELAGPDSVTICRGLSVK